MRKNNSSHFLSLTSCRNSGDPPLLPGHATWSPLGYDPLPWSREANTPAQSKGLCLSQAGLDGAAQEMGVAEVAGSGLRAGEWVPLPSPRLQVGLWEPYSPFGSPG